MIKKVKRKEKKKYEKERIGKLHVWALVDEISKEWKDVKDKTIKEALDNIEKLKEDLELNRRMLNQQTEAYNKHIHKSNLLNIEKDILITQLRNQIQSIFTMSLSQITNLIQNEIDNFTNSAKEIAGPSSEYANIHYSAAMDGFRVLIEKLNSIQKGECVKNG